MLPIVDRIFSLCYATLRTFSIYYLVTLQKYLLYVKHSVSKALLLSETEITREGGILGREAATATASSLYECFDDAGITVIIIERDSVL